MNRAANIADDIFTNFRKDFTAIRRINLMKCLFSKDSLQWFFSKEGEKPDKPKLEETEKTHTPKNA